MEALTQKQYILFDLDGTITDSATGIINSIVYGLNKFGITVDNRDGLYKFIGTPLKESLEECYSLSREEGDILIEYYREYYRETGIYENTVYNGIPALLEALANNNKSILLATSKPVTFARKILRYFQLDKYFTFIAGSELDGTRVKKDEVIQYALANCNASDLSKAVMIGDTKFDILGAKKVGIDSIGVLYGYGDYDELSSARADCVVKDVDELHELFQSDKISDTINYI